jgi:quinol monooxygenase YgiN
MIFIVTYIEVQPSRTAEAADLIRQYCSASAAMLQEVYRPSRFVVLEEWKDAESLQLHEISAPTAEFRSRLKQIHNSPYDPRTHHGFAMGPAWQRMESGALFVVTHVDVPPPRKDETEVLLKNAAEQSRNDPGNLRYDVVQQTARPNHFTVVSVWRDDASFASHGSAAHTITFRESLAPMLGGLYDERLYKDMG